MRNETNFSEGCVVTLKRTFDAPVDLVWEAWINSEHITKWWGPKGMTTRIIEHNFEVGGKWKYSMTMPNGQEFISEGVFKEIIKHKKIISSADFKPMTEGVEIQALFEEAGESTLFTFNIVHASEEYRIAQEKMGIYNGWGSVLERLGEFVEK